MAQQVFNVTTDKLNDIIPQLRVGDRVYLSGTVYTARDAAHKRIFALLDEGAELPSLLPFPLSLEIRATLAGGRAILDKIESQNFDTLSKRPAFNKLDKVKILIRALLK